MDGRDVRLSKAVTDLGMGSPEKLHEATDIPVSTIHYRLNNLKDDGVIGNDLCGIDLEAFRLSVAVVVEALVDYSGSCEEVRNKLPEIEGIMQLHFTMGGTNFIVVAHPADSDRVERLISDFEATPEVERTNSMLVTSSMRDGHRMLQSYTLKILLGELGIED